MITLWSINHYLLNSLCYSKQNFLQFKPILPRGPLCPHYRPPPYHGSVCQCRMVRATLTKLPDFVPFHICHVPESQFWCFFFKKFKKFDVENFWGSSSLRRKSENFEIFRFFTNKPYFFKLNLNCTCSQLSFEVHNTLETQNFENFEFFSYNIDWKLPPSSD